MDDDLWLVDFDPFCVFLCFKLLIGYQFKTFDSNSFTLSSMFSFQHVWPIHSFAHQAS